ncbi:MAG: Ig-like domain-containing protein, partial [Weeksellaceae bacterium]|nr:Ig-like domain-containing protein [Weeksellaceae bacterium]
MLAQQSTVENPYAFSSDTIQHQITAGRSIRLRSQHMPLRASSSYQVLAAPYIADIPPVAANARIFSRQDERTMVRTFPSDFNFCFFNQLQEAYQVCSNGIISFRGTNLPVNTCGLEDFMSLPHISADAASNHGFFMLRHLLNPQNHVSTGRNRTSINILGQAPFRRLVVSFDQVPHKTPAPMPGVQASSTFQLILYETTGVMEVVIQDKPIPHTQDNPATLEEYLGKAVLGIQNLSGSQSYSPPGRNLGVWSAHQESWRFQPSGPEYPTTVKWFTQENVLISESSSLQYTPQNNTILRAEVTYTLCDNRQVVVNQYHSLRAESIEFDLPSSFCVGDTFILPENSSGPNPVTGIWTNEDNDVINSVNTSLPGYFSYTFTAGEDTYSYNFQVQENIQAVFDQSEYQICTDQTLSFPSPSNNVQGTWSPNLTTSGNYTFTPATDSCALPTTISITLINPPNAGTISGAESLCVGENLTLISDGDPGGTWSSADTAIATVSETGVVTGVSFGPVTITYTVAGTAPCEPATATIPITIQSPPDAGTISGATPLCVGENLTLTTDGDPGGTWSSSDTDIATVSSAGVVSAVSFGPVSITYTVAGTAPCESATATIPITIQSPPDAGTISGATPLCVGENLTLTTDGDPGGTWSSSDTDIATVSSAGVVSAVSFGPVSITYTVAGTAPCESATATIPITIQSPPDAGTISGATPLCVGENLTLTTDGDPGGTWSSSDTDIATVSSAGVVSAVSFGPVSITYTVAGTAPCESATATIPITIQSPPDAGTISGATPLCVGENLTLTTDGDPGGTWSSSDTDIATVSSAGVVSAVSFGPVSITYTVAGTAPC